MANVFLLGGRLEQRSKSGSRWGSGLSLFSGMGVVSKECEELCAPKLKAPQTPPILVSESEVDLR